MNESSYLKYYILIWCESVKIGVTKCKIIGKYWKSSIYGVPKKPQPT